MLWPQMLIAFVSGALMPLAFAPFSYWPIAILSPALLIYQSGFTNRIGTGFLLGTAYGLGYFGFGVYWIYNSLHVYGHAPEIVAGGLTLLMIVTLSLFIGTTLWLYRRLILRYKHWAAIYSLPLLWFSMEWFKGWVLTGFPWLSLGYAHINSPLSGYAPITGVYGLSALSLFISLFLIRAIKHQNFLLLLPIFIISLAGYGLHNIEWTESAGEPLNITMVQGNIPQEMKWRRDDRQKIIDSYWDATKKHWDSDLVVWPEVAIPGRSEDLQEQLLKPLSEQARDNNSSLLTGIIVSNWIKREYYNSMLMIGANQGVYHKRHLVPFGEYYPFRDLLDFMKAYIKIPMSDMSAGPDQQPLMSVNESKLGVSICYEDVFSRDINLDLPAANILINTSNDAWFGDSLAPHQHLEIAQMRSLETGRPMVRSTNTGRSAFINHKGQIIAATQQFKAQTLSEELQGRSGSTPFLMFAMIQPWLATLFLLLALVLINRKQPL
jgi:apolipoprotein N-acyltransferase